MCLLEGMEDEDTESMLVGVYAVLVIEAGVTKRLDLSLFPQFGLSGDLWVTFVDGGIVLVERCRYPQLILVGHVWEYKDGDFDGFRTGELNQEKRLEENFSDSSEVVVLWLADNGGEGLNVGFKFCGYVR